MAGSVLDTALENLEQAVSAVRAAAESAGPAGDGVAAAVHAASGGAIDPFVFRLAIFVLAIFVGYYVVWSVTPALHTPLMAVTNAISSIIILGALIQIGSSSLLITVLAAAGILMASVNIFGGFMVTRRMLAMYKKKETPAPKAGSK